MLPEGCDFQTLHSKRNEPSIGELINVALEEIAENDFNLNIPRYVDTFEEGEPVDR